MAEETILVKIDEFVNDAQKAAMDDWDEGDNKIWVLPLGHLIQLALKHRVETANGFSEKKAKTLAILQRTTEIVTAYQKKEM